MGTVWVISTSQCHLRLLYHLGNLQDPVAPEGLRLMRQVLYSSAKLFSSLRAPTAAETLCVLKDYTCRFLQSAGSAVCECRHQACVQVRLSPIYLSSQGSTETDRPGSASVTGQTCENCQTNRRQSLRQESAAHQTLPTLTPSRHGQGALLWHHDTLVFSS